MYSKMKFAKIVLVLVYTVLSLYTGLSKGCLLSDKMWYCFAFIFYICVQFYHLQSLSLVQELVLQFSDMLHVYIHVCYLLKWLKQLRQCRLYSTWEIYSKHTSLKTTNTSDSDNNLGCRYLKENNCLLRIFTIA